MAEDPEAITARYDDRDRAGRAVEQLSRAGIEAGRIRVLGPDTGTDRPSQRGTDTGTTRRLGRRLLQGASIGAAAGAVLGAVVVAVTTGVDVGGAMLAVIGGAVAGAGIGALTGLQSTPTMAGAWEDTFAPDRDGSVTLAVELRTDRAGSHHSAEDVEEVLATTGARDIRRVSDLRAAERRLRGSD